MASNSPAVDAAPTNNSKVRSSGKQYRPATTRLSRLLYGDAYDPLEDDEARKARALAEFAERQYDAAHPPLAGLLHSLEQYKQVFLGVAFGIVANQVLQSLADWLFPGESQTQLLLWLGVFAFITLLRFVSVALLHAALRGAQVDRSPWALKVQEQFAKYTNVVTLVAFGVISSLLLQSFVTFIFPDSNASKLLLSLGVFALVLAISLVFGCAANVVQHKVIDPFVQRYERSHRSQQTADNKTLARSIATV